MNKTLEQLYHSFLFSLGQELEHYQELIEVIEDEAPILIQSRLEDVLDFNTRKERALLSLNVATEMRLEAQHKIIAHLNLEEPVSMKQLIAYAQNDTRQNLLQYQEKFTDLRVHLDKMNKNNMSLITFSLSQLSNTLNYINTITAPSPNYDHCGQIKAGKLQGRLISQEG